MNYSSVAIHPASCQCARCQKIERQLSLVEYVRFDINPKSHGCTCGHSFCPRKVQAASGFVLGFFLIVHLGLLLFGLRPDSFKTLIRWLHSSEPILAWFEMTTLFLPLVIHTGMGLYLLSQAGLKMNTGNENHGSNIRFFWQRITALYLFVFLIFHIGTFHRWGFHLIHEMTDWSALDRYTQGGLFNLSAPFTSIVNGVRYFWNAQLHAAPGNFIVVVLYGLAVVAAVYHMANGVLTGTRVLNILPQATIQNRFWKFCLLLGIILLIIGFLDLYAYTVVPGFKH